MSKLRFSHYGERGFSLVEVLIALVVIALSLLGVAGMQAISISNTDVAGYRSIAALQAASIAAAMSANQAYWQQSTVATSTSVLGTSSTAATVTSTDSALTGSSTSCLSSSCSPSSMAAYDLQNWGITLFNILPSGAGAVTCTAATATAPATCQIKITWIEKSLQQNQAAGGSSTLGTPDFEMMVQP